VLLADDLVERARAHPYGQGAARGVLLLAFLCGCGEQVGFHVLKPMPAL
jgi:hypothetical protein